MPESTSWMDWWLSNSSDLERIGLVAFMFFVIVSGFFISVWLYRAAEQRNRLCEVREREAYNARLEDTKERGEIREKLGQLSGEVAGLKMTKEQLEVERAVHIDAIKEMMTTSLKMVNNAHERDK